MVERPKMHYWAGVGPQDGEYFAAIRYDTRADGGIFFEGSLMKHGLLELSQLTVKFLFEPLKAAGYEPEPVNGSSTGIGRKLTPKEEQQILQALKGK